MICEAGGFVFWWSLACFSNTASVPQKTDKSQALLVDTNHTKTRLV